MSFVINQKIKYNVVQEREIFFDNERLAQLNKYIHKNYDIDENFECTMEDVRQAFDISNTYERLQVRVNSKDKTRCFMLLKYVVRECVEDCLDIDSDWCSDGKWERDITLETTIDEEDDDYIEEKEG